MEYSSGLRLHKPVHFYHRRILITTFAEHSEQKWCVSPTTHPPQTACDRSHFDALGHTIVPATIPTGTMLFYGNDSSASPPALDWLAFDFEHSYIFCRADCYVTSYMASRPLHLLYLDGASASKLQDGALDVQDILIWGKPSPDKVFDEDERIQLMCEWGMRFGLDGFVRMEMHLYVSKVCHCVAWPDPSFPTIRSEVMMCDFSDGLKLISKSNLILHDADLADVDVPVPEFSVKVPPGWRGSIPNFDAVSVELLNAGSWHDRPPGETRIRVDYSRAVTFYDRSLTSLVDARRGLRRRQHRVGNISASDFAHVMEEVREVLVRDSADTGSGIDWGSATHVIVERYGGRLELLNYILDPESFPNVTHQAAIAREQLLIMLNPYLLVQAVPEPSADPAANTSWVMSIAQRCARTQTLGIPLEQLTKQERRILDAIEDVLHEICRVLTEMWIDAFDIEAASEKHSRTALQSWRQSVQDLMAWLDWAVWVRCNPACGPEVR